MQNNPWGEFIARPFGKYFPQDEHFINSSFSLSKSKFSALRSFDNPSRIMKYLNQKNRAVEKHTLLFNHPEFLKAWRYQEEIF